MRRATRRGPGPSHLLITPDRAGNVVGIDPHKQTLTATVADPRGGIVASAHFRWASCAGGVGQAVRGDRSVGGGGRVTACYAGRQRSPRHVLS
jgi:hypothetical protein